jgi:hypothetical protein
MVHQKVAGGLYNSASEVVREALRISFNHADRVGFDSVQGKLFQWFSEWIIFSCVVSLVHLSGLDSVSPRFICGRLWLNTNIYGRECDLPHLRTKPARD